MYEIAAVSMSNSEINIQVSHSMDCMDIDKSMYSYRQHNRIFTKKILIFFILQVFTEILKCDLSSCPEFV